MTVAVAPKDDHLDLGRLAEVVAEKLAPHQRPRFVRAVSDIAMTDGYRPLKRTLIDEGLSGRVYRLGDDGRYRALEEASEADAPTSRA